MVRRALLPLSVALAALVAASFTPASRAVAAAMAGVTVRDSNFSPTQLTVHTGDTVAKRDFSTSSHYFHSGLWQRANPISAGYRLGLSLRWRLATKHRQTSQAEAE